MSWASTSAAGRQRPARPLHKAFRALGRRGAPPSPKRAFGWTASAPSASCCPPPPTKQPRPATGRPSAYRRLAAPRRLDAIRRSAGRIACCRCPPHRRHPPGPRRNRPRRRHCRTPRRRPRRHRRAGRDPTASAPPARPAAAAHRQRAPRHRAHPTGRGCRRPRRRGLLPAHRTPQPVSGSISRAQRSALRFGAACRVPTGARGSGGAVTADDGAGTEFDVVSRFECASRPFRGVPPTCRSPHNRACGTDPGDARGERRRRRSGRGGAGRSHAAKVTTAMLASPNRRDVTHGDHMLLARQSSEMPVKDEHRGRPVSHRPTAGMIGSDLRHGVADAERHAAAQTTVPLCRPLDRFDHRTDSASACLRSSEGARLLCPSGRRQQVLGSAAPEHRRVDHRGDSVEGHCLAPCWHSPHSGRLPDGAVRDVAQRQWLGRGGHRPNRCRLPGVGRHARPDEPDVPGQAPSRSHRNGPTQCEYGARRGSRTGYRGSAAPESTVDVLNREHAVSKRVMAQIWSPARVST